MAVDSAIEWTEATWNPVTGCSKLSPGCKFCYAERMAERLRAMGQPRYANGFWVTMHDDLVDLPLRWRRGRTIFVNSMSDLFHEDVSDEFILRVFRTMERASQHTFQVLTKRSDRLRALAPKLPWPRNVWQGVSVESAAYVGRVADLARVDAAVRFLSVEPLLSAIPELPLDGIDWVIVGGESGPGARPMKPAWVDEIHQQCAAANVPFFFKQWGGVQKARFGRELKGTTWDAMPEPKSRWTPPGQAVAK